MHYMHTHTHTHTCMHAHRHACTHTHTHSLAEQSSSVQITVDVGPASEVVAEQVLRECIAQIKIHHRQNSVDLPKIAVPLNCFPNSEYSAIHSTGTWREREGGG